MVFVYIFISSFIVNLLWENSHAPLYLLHLGQKITEKTLVIASLGDAVILTSLAVLFYSVPFLRNHLWLSILFGVIISIIIELYALGVNRWSYNEHMILVPFLHVGLSPVLQLGFIGYVIFKIFL